MQYKKFIRNINNGTRVRLPGGPAIRLNVIGIAVLFLLSAVFTTAAWHFMTSAVLAGSKSPAAVGVAFGPTVPNTQPQPGTTPRGMVWIPGGEFSMGAQDPPGMDMVGMQATKDSRPIHRVYVDGFFMDKTDVTNAQFAAFVKAAGYITIAEKAPTADE